MDAGQLGVVIKVMNFLTGAVLTVWVGAISAWTVISFAFCDSDTSYEDGGCGITQSDQTLASPGFFNNFSALVISLYMVPLGSIIIVYELCTTRNGGQESTAAPPGIAGKLAGVKEKLVLYFGFIFFYRRRMQFLIFVGILCLGNQIKCNDTNGACPAGVHAASAALVGGILALVNALVHWVVKRQHPEFDDSVQKAISGSEAQEAGGAAAYTLDPALEAPHYASGSGAAAPAPAPYMPPPANMYGDGGDGGTAI
jgi:hypothetical protein